MQFLDAFLVYFKMEPLPGLATVAFAAEPFVEGPYVKHSNNFGWADDERNTPHAFSHFTFEQSHKMVLIVDIQGVHDIYTGTVAFLTYVG